MNSYLRKALPVYVFILTIAGLLLIPSLNENAGAQPPCFARICKVAPELPEPQNDEEAVLFPYQISEGDVDEFIEIAANALCAGDTFSGDDYQIREEFLPGWLLADVECSDSVEIDVFPIENGVSLDCLGPSEITCTFTNVRGSISNIPTLSEWGMIAAAGCFALIGVFFAMRRKRMQDA